MKGKLTRRYRLNLYSHANEVIVSTDSNCWDVLQTIYDNYSHHYPNAAFLVKDCVTGKWHENFDLIKFDRVN